MESLDAKDPPKPCDYFDMIGGTSTGGLIAIMLGRLQMSVDECIVEYKKLSPAIFTHIHHRVNISGHIQGRFDHEALERGIRSLLSSRGLDEDELFGEDLEGSKCKTFVCATSRQTSETVVLSSYYSERRGNDLRRLAKIWEVARATSAASSFFEPIDIGGEGFVDGGTGANNPILEIWSEAADVFNQGGNWKLEDNLQCLVSVGTGKLHLTAFGTSLVRNEIGEALVAIATNTEKVADTFQKHHSNIYEERRAFRFNVGQGLEEVGLEEAGKVVDIEAATRRYISTQDTYLSLQACATGLKQREYYEDLQYIYDSLEFSQMDDRWDRIEEAHEATFRWILPTEVLQGRQLPAAMESPPDAEASSCIASGLEEENSHRLTPNAPGSRVESNTSDFTKWLEMGEEPIFWISGKAAAGKSTLMKHMYQRPELQNILSRSYSNGRDNLVFASFFFYDQGKSTLQKSREGLLRGLLHQILKDRKEIWRNVLAKCQMFFEKNRKLKLQGRPPTFEIHWSWADLHLAFEKFATEKPAALKIFFLVDGLDEFRLLDAFDDYLDYEDDEDTVQVRRNIMAHQTIANFFLNLSTYPGFKLCLSSRPLQAFESTFSKFPGFKLQDLTLNDIRQYVEDRLRSHPRFLRLAEVEPWRTRAIINEISSKASGVFLWVKLVVKIILDAVEAGDSISQLEGKINELPPALRGLYSTELASVLPEYREEGQVLFRRILAARSHLTELTLSFSDESKLFALKCPIGRISEPAAQLRIDEIDRRLKSRCGGLLEIVPNPYRSTLCSTENGKRLLRNLDQVSWNLRPHIAMEPIVTFVHRTVVEYLQSRWKTDGETQPARITETADLQLLISCLLRIKLIGRTALVWEIWHALKDAVFHAKRIEKQARSSPTDLLDAIGDAARSLWVQGISAGRPEDYDKDPGFGPAALEARRGKGVPEGQLNPIHSIWGPRFCEHGPICSCEGDDFITLAVQGDLRLYLKDKLKTHGTGILNRPWRRHPLVGYTKMRHVSLTNIPLSSDSNAEVSPPSSTDEWLKKHGYSEISFWLKRWISKGISKLISRFWKKE